MQPWGGLEIVGCGSSDVYVGCCGVREGGCFEWRFACIWSWCPRTGTTDCDGCLQTRDEVNPGQVVKYSMTIAFIYVERAGNLVAACKRAVRLYVQGMVAALCGIAQFCVIAALWWKFPEL